MLLSNFKTSDVYLTHLYYIHHSDQPGYSLVPIKLNGTNYKFWSKLFMHGPRNDPEEYSLVPNQIKRDKLPNQIRSRLEKK